MKNTGNINITSDMELTMNSTTKVTSYDKIIMYFPFGGKTEELDVKIEADFSKLKPEHHELFLNTFISRYNHHTNVYNSHTNYDGSKVPILRPKKRISLIDKIKKIFK